MVQRLLDGHVWLEASKWFVPVLDQVYPMFFTAVPASCMQLDDNCRCVGLAMLVLRRLGRHGRKPAIDGHHLTTSSRRAQ